MSDFSILDEAFGRVPDPEPKPEPEPASMEQRLVDDMIRAFEERLNELSRELDLYCEEPKPEPTPAPDPKPRPKPPFPGPSEDQKDLWAEIAEAQRVRGRTVVVDGWFYQKDPDPNRGQLFREPIQRVRLGDVEVRRYQTSRSLEDRLRYAFYEAGIRAKDIRSSLIEDLEGEL